MHRMFKNTSKVALSLALIGLAAGAGATDINLSKQISSVNVSGDLRLRQETSLPKTAGQIGRSRQRYRLRIAVDLPLNDSLMVKTRFASGVGEQTSTNQSFDNLSSQNPLWIDRAYLEWKPFSTLKVSGGRMANPLWLVYSSEAVWDDDLNPMGFAFNAARLMGPVNAFLNGMYMVGNENGGSAPNSLSAKDVDEISYQIGGEVKLPLESRIKVGFAQHQWVNERSTNTFGAADGSLPPAKAVGGNRITSNHVANEFRVNELTADLSFWVMSTPVHVLGTFLKNADALDPNATPTPAGFTAGQKKGDKGSEFGAIIGKASEAKSWEVAYFMKKMESDVTVADASDSDFPGTGRKGSIYWVAYNPTNYTQFKVKYFDTKYEDMKLTPSGGTATNDDHKALLQADFSVKF